MGSSGDNDPRDVSDTTDAADSGETGVTFARGLALFNTGEFFACHEVWEELWLRSSGEEKLFYKGLIQAAVAILHAERGNFRGAISTWRKASAKLDPLPTHHMGIALGEFRADSANFFADAADSAALPVRPKLRCSRENSP
jgi:hypothetical protein